MLLESLRTKEACVGIIGLGYVGLPLAYAGIVAGYRIVAFDIDPLKINRLNRGESYLRHIDPSPLAVGLKDKRFRATTDFASIAEVDAIVICVPTPLGPHREPDTSFISKTIESILPYLRPGQLVSLESSTYPTTTRSLVAEPIQQAGLVVGEDVFVVYSPEREDPGNRSFAVSQIPKLLGGMTEKCSAVAVALYENLVSSVVVTESPEIAEMAKLLENIYRAVNIGLVNEMKTVADRMGIDIWKVIDAASTKPFGFTPFYPGPGLGGHCIPIDPFYLTWKAREVGVNTRFIELAGEINSAMPAWVVTKTVGALNARGVAMSSARILVLGVAYKKNIDDMRESPAVEIIEQLQAARATVDYSDPHVAKLPAMRRHELDMSSVVLDSEALGRYDCVVLTTDHDLFDYELILESSHLIIDTRGRFRDKNGKVVQA